MFYDESPFEELSGGIKCRFMNFNAANAEKPLKNSVHLKIILPMFNVYIAQKRMLLRKCQRLQPLEIEQVSISMKTPVLPHARAVLQGAAQPAIINFMK